MHFKYDSLDYIKQPALVHCTQSRKGKGILDVDSLVIGLKFCETSEMSFDIYQDHQGFESIRKGTVIKSDGFGYWSVDEVEENDDGVYKIKNVKAYSYEVVLGSINITLKEDSYYLYNELNADKSLLGLIENNTNWKIGHVDITLTNKKRTLEFENTAIYDALMKDISEAFKCYFVFDTDTMTINCYDRMNRPKRSGIMLSFRNLIKEMKIKDNQDGIITALTVTGGDGVGINLVNPLGTNTIYDFHYYYDEMSPDLKNAIILWQESLSDISEEYKEKVALRRSLATTKTTLESDLAVLETSLKAKKDVQSVNIVSGNEERLPPLKQEIKALESQIREKNAEIEDVDNRHTEAVKACSEISTALSMKNNFTEEQYKELMFYIRSGSYENENFIFTSITTEEEEIDIEGELYEQALIEFKKFADARYQFEVDLINFINNPIYKPFLTNLELGYSAMIEIKDDTWTDPRIIGINLDFNNVENTNIILSDSLMLQDGVYSFATNYTNTSKAANKVAISASKWDEPSKNGFYDTVNDYIRNALDLARQEIINAKNQEFTIGSYGIRGRQENGDSYSDEQIAIINNLIAFTDDGWNSVKTALGKVAIGDQQYYGLVAEAIVGNLVAADHLIISNENNTFEVTADGATLSNAILTVENTLNKILIDPENGIKIQTKKSDGSTDDVFYTGVDGNIIAKSIKLESSNIGGWTTTSEGITDSKGNYINSDGTGQLSLLTWSQGVATFNGNIYAHNLYSSVGGTHIFVNGTMGGSWLTDGTVGKGKLDTLWVNEIDGVIADFDEIKAKMITTDLLRAGKIGADDILYGGKIYAGTADNNVTLYSTLMTIDEQHPNQQSFECDVQGNFVITTATGQFQVTGRNGNVGSIYTDGWVTTKGSMYCNGDEFRALGKSDLQGDLRVLGTSDIQGDITFARAIKTNYYGTVYQGASGTFYDKDGKKIVVANGLIVGIDANFNL